MQVTFSVHSRSSALLHIVFTEQNTVLLNQLVMGLKKPKGIHHKGIHRDAECKINLCV